MLLFDLHRCMRLRLRHFITCSAGTHCGRARHWLWKVWLRLLALPRPILLIQCGQCVQCAIWQIGNVLVLRQGKRACWRQSRIAVILYTRHGPNAWQLYDNNRINYIANQLGAFCWSPGKCSTSFWTMLDSCFVWAAQFFPFNISERHSQKQISVQILLNLTNSCGILSHAGFMDRCLWLACSRFPISRSRLAGAASAKRTLHVVFKAS